MLKNPDTTIEAMQILELADRRVASRLQPIVNQLLSIPLDLPYPGFPVVDGQWVTSDGTVLCGPLDGFLGYLDVETTGLSQSDRVTGAVGIGYLWGEATVVAIRYSKPDLLRIQNSVIANWNQPFDRQFYYGKDTNIHIDLMGLCMAVRGKPDKVEWKLPYQHTWENYVHQSISLKNVLADRFGGEYLDKSVRDDIVNGTATPEEILEYCYRDTQATVKVGQDVIREYLVQTPSLISLLGHILRHSFDIPFSQKFDGYWERVEEWYQGQITYKNSCVRDLIWESLIPSCPQHQSLQDNYPEKFQPRYLNGWFKFMGHTTLTKATKKNKAKPKQPKFSYQIQRQLLPLATLISDPELVDLFLPKYLWELLGKNFHPATRAYGLVIPLEWMGNPVTYNRETKQWIAGGEVMENLADKSKALSSPLCKEYLKLLDEGLTSSTLDPTFVKAIKDTVRWGMFRDRVRDLEVRDGWLKPLYSPTGTLSQRAIDKVFLLVGSPKPDQGGTELMSMIEAKPGYVIIQADLDSAELVLAGLVACEVAGVKIEDGHPFSKANLLGEKKSGTDTHSIIAKQIGITRDGAKTRVYAGVYGEGMEARIQGIMRQLGCDRPTAEKLARAFTDSFIKGLAKDFFTGINLMSDLLLPTKLLSRAVPLAYRYASGDMVTSIRNHHIQSLGVDWLDTIETLVMLACEDEQIDATLILTRHDELVYHVLEEHSERFSEILQLAHRVAKFCICHQFGVTQPNEKWSWFSSVDISDRYRKEPNAPISTVTTTFE
jgi:DNA polymerase gamma 1